MAATKSVPSEGYSYVHGFGSLAAFIADDEDHATSIYKRFNGLAARNLLYYQSELAELAALQQQYDIEDCDGLEDGMKAFTVRRYNQNWNAIAGTGIQSGPNVPGLPSQQAGMTPPSATPSSTQMNGAHMGLERQQRRDLATRIRTTLKDYREALIEEATLLAYEKPSQQALSAFANYYHGRTADGTSHPMLTGASATLYPPGLTSSQVRSTDLISLAPRQESDHLTGFFKSYLPCLFRTASAPLLPQPYDLPTITHPKRFQIRHYSSRLLSTVTSFITTILAALLLFLPIYVLYHVSRDQAGLTLGLIALFTLLFALAIVLTTNARRAEVFGACAAYAAVLVVFVSGDFAAGTG